MFSKPNLVHKIMNKIIVFQKAIYTHLCIHEVYGSIGEIQSAQYVNRAGYAILVKSN